MSSNQQIVANRRNARLSTGPRTSAGKAKVSMNALKHGLTGRDVVLPNENPDEFESFRTNLLADLAPKGSLESVLAEKIVIDFWRLRRVPILEAAIYRRALQERIVNQAAEACRRYETTASELMYALVEKREVAACDREAHAEAQKRLDSVRAALDEPSFNVTRVLGECAGLFTNLSRHEVALFRSVTKTLHEFQRLQAARAGQHVAAPAVVDVNLNLPDSSLPVEGGDESD